MEGRLGRIRPEPQLPLQLPGREAGPVQIQHLGLGSQYLGRGPPWGELHLELHLVVGDGPLAATAGSPRAGTAPRPPGFTRGRVRS